MEELKNPISEKSQLTSYAVHARAALELLPAGQHQPKLSTLHSSLLPFSFSLYHSSKEKDGGLVFNVDGRCMEVEKISRSEFMPLPLLKSIILSQTGRISGLGTGT